MRKNHRLEGISHTLWPLSRVFRQRAQGIKKRLLREQIGHCDDPGRRAANS